MLMKWYKGKFHLIKGLPKVALFLKRFQTFDFIQLHFILFYMKQQLVNLKLNNAVCLKCSPE